MEVSATDIARIPGRNIHVPREDFAAVWREAERRNEVLGSRGDSAWFNAGVCVTCRWLAATAVRPPDGRSYLAPSPITRRTARAYEELIVAECYEAEKLSLRRPVPSWLQRRPGWVEGILATLDWAWRRNGRPPIEVPRRATVSG
ncbi:MAG: hypothetical protein GEU97_07050 [Actinophytocola sp.]|nr:hypothetical protein [Actinophytocola sp.]